MRCGQSLQKRCMPGVGRSKIQPGWCDAVTEACCGGGDTMGSNGITVLLERVLCIWLDPRVTIAFLI